MTTVMRSQPGMPTSRDLTSVQLDALRTSERRWAYALLRLFLGVDLLGRGLVRIYHGVPAFAAAVTTHISSALLPAPLVHTFALAIPWIQLTLGALLILAVFTRATLTAAMLFVIVLMVGVTIRQDWTAAGLQLVYGFVIFSLLFLRIPYASGWSDLLGLRPPPGDPS